MVFWSVCFVTASHVYRLVALEEDGRPALITLHHEQPATAFAGSCLCCWSSEPFCHLSNGSRAVREFIFMGFHPALSEVFLPSFQHEDVVIAQKRSPWRVFTACSGVAQRTDVSDCLLLCLIAC